MKLGKPNITDVNSLSGDIHNCSHLIELSFNLKLIELMPFMSSRFRCDFKCQQLRFCDVIDIWAASYYDVTLTDYSDAVSMDAFIIKMDLPNGEVSAWRFIAMIVTGFIAILLRFRGRIEIVRSALEWFVLLLQHSTSWAVARPQATYWPRGETFSVCVTLQTPHRGWIRVALKWFCYIRHPTRADII